MKVIDLPSLELKYYTIQFIKVKTKINCILATYTTKK